MSKTRKLLGGNIWVVSAVATGVVEAINGKLRDPGEARPLCASSVVVAKAVVAFAITNVTPAPAFPVYEQIADISVDVADGLLIATGVEVPDLNATLEKQV